MESADIKLAMDMLEAIDFGEPCEENLSLAYVINVLSDCGNEITSLKQQLADSEAKFIQTHEWLCDRNEQLAEAQKVIATINSLRSEALEIFSGSHMQAELDVIEWYSASIDAAISAQKE